jgi:RNA polymerase sigma-70 factor, ECF subfamily
MVTYPATATSTEGRRSMDATSDNELLEAIGTNRDRGAFSTLYQRHERAAYALAMHITGRRDLAEEALQEAMLKVWSAASNFRPDGNARGWILRIVAREGLAAQKKQRKEKLKMERTRESQRGAAAAADDPVEHGELQAALQLRLDELTGTDRQLVALYFGAGMSQHEIGEAVSMPQRTVADRINGVLERLRMSLTQAGLAAAVPLLNADGLGNALCSGHAVPAGLQARVLTHVTNTGTQVAEVARQVSKRASRRAVPAATGGSAWVIGGVILAVAAVAGSMAASRNKPAPPASDPPPEAKAEVIAEPAASAAVEDKPFSKVWTFENGLPSDFGSRDSLKDKYEWRKLPDGGEVVAIAPVVLRLPVTAPKRPFVVKVDIKLVIGADSTIDGIWQTSTEGLAHHVWNAVPSAATSDRNSVSFYYLGRHVVNYWKGKVIKIREFDQPYPSDKVCLWYRGCGTTRIEVKTLEENEIPSEMKDIARLKQWISNQKGSQSGPVPKFGITAAGSITPP